MIIYLAAPYSYKSKSKEIGLSKPDTSQKEKQVKEDRFNKINTVAAKLFKQEYTVFSPISHSHPIAISNDLAGNIEFWLEHDLKMLERCDILFVLMLEGWKESTGVQHEINFAKGKNMPIVYINEQLTIGG